MTAHALARAARYAGLAALLGLGYAGGGVGGLVVALSAWAVYRWDMACIEELEPHAQDCLCCPAPDPVEEPKGVMIVDHVKESPYRAPAPPVEKLVKRPLSPTARAHLTALAGAAWWGAWIGVGYLCWGGIGVIATAFLVPPVTALYLFAAHELRQYYVEKDEEGEKR